MHRAVTGIVVGGLLLIGCQLGPVSAPGAVASPSPSPSPELVTTAEATAAFEAYLTTGGLAGYDLEGGALRTADDAARRKEQASPKPATTSTPDRVNKVLVPHQSSYPAHFLATETFNLQAGDDKGKSLTELWIFTKQNTDVGWLATYQVTFSAGVSAPEFDLDKDGFLQAVPPDQLSKYSIDGQTLSAHFAQFANDTIGGAATISFDAELAPSADLSSLLADRRKSKVDITAKHLVDTVTWKDEGTVEPVYRLKDGRAFMSFVNTENDILSANPGGKVSIGGGKGDGITYPKDGLYSQVEYLRMAMVSGFVSPAGSDAKTELAAYYYRLYKMTPTA
ncbi:MAG: hypothetical protein QOE92_344 [Chloroflexota bacterium]|jgi:hypothetical protein|nr:hypothetical protein [Chloroflexota bacterium]